MKVHFNYRGFKPTQDIQLVIEDDNFTELYVSKFYKSEAMLLMAFFDKTIEREQKDFDYDAELKKVKQSK